MEPVFALTYLAAVSRASGVCPEGACPWRAPDLSHGATPIAAPLFRGLRRAARWRDVGRAGITAAWCKAGTVSGVSAPSAIPDAMRAAGMRLCRHDCCSAWREGSSWAVMLPGRRAGNDQAETGETRGFLPHLARVNAWSFPARGPEIPTLGTVWRSYAGSGGA